jgi:HK97 gp10 family phage protein
MARGRKAIKNMTITNVHASGWSVVIDQSGLKGLRKVLEDIEDAQTIEVKKAVSAGLIAIRNEARRNLKTNWTMRTRSLWRSIRAVQDLDGLGGLVGTFERDPDNWYGHFLEFGTRRGIKKKPWLYPAYRNQKGKFNRRIYRAIRKAIRDNKQ